LGNASLYPIVRPQHESSCRRDDLLDGLGLQFPKYGDTGNDLKIAGRQS
jgi:hypothetical protein